MITNDTFPIFVFYCSTYIYDAQVSLLTSVTVQDKTTSYTYNNKRDIESATYPNGEQLRHSFNPSTGFLEETIALNQDGHVSTNLSTKHDWNGFLKVINNQDESHVTYSLDETMNILSFERNDGIPFRSKTLAKGNTAIRNLLHGDQVAFYFIRKFIALDIYCFVVILLTMICWFRW